MVSAILENFNETNATTYSWTVDQVVDVSVTIVIADSTGALALSGESPRIAAGSSSSWWVGEAEHLAEEGKCVYVVRLTQITFPSYGSVSSTASSYSTAPTSTVSSSSSTA